MKISRVEEERISGIGGWGWSRNWIGRWEGLVWEGERMWKVVRRLPPMVKAREVGVARSRALDRRFLSMGPVGGSCLRFKVLLMCGRVLWV